MPVAAGEAVDSEYKVIAPCVLRFLVHFLSTPSFSQQERSSIRMFYLFFCITVQPRPLQLFTRMLVWVSSCTLYCLTFILRILRMVHRHRAQSNPGAPPGGPGVSTLLVVGPVGGAPPNMADSISPNGFAACPRGGGMAKYNSAISLRA